MSIDILKNKILRVPHSRALLLYHVYIYIYMCMYIFIHTYESVIHVYDISYICISTCMYISILFCGNILRAEFDKVVHIYIDTCIYNTCILHIM